MQKTEESKARVPASCQPVNLCLATDELACAAAREHHTRLPFPKRRGRMPAHTGVASRTCLSRPMGITRASSRSICCISSAVTCAEARSPVPGAGEPLRPLRRSRPFGPLCQTQPSVPHPLQAPRSQHGRPAQLNAGERIPPHPPPHPRPLSRPRRAEFDQSGQRRQARRELGQMQRACRSGDHRRLF